MVHEEVEYISLNSYQVRDIYSEKSLAKKLFNSILFIQSNDILQELLDNEEYSLLSHVDLEADKANIHENIGVVNCPICGGELDHSEHPMTFADVLVENPEKSLNVMPMIEYPSIVVNGQKLKGRKINYVRCQKCVNDINNLYIKNGYPLTNPNLDRLAEEVGKYLGLSIIKKMDIQFNISHLYPMQKYFYHHKNTNTTIYLNIYEVVAHINYLWELFKKNRVDTYKEEELTHLRENLGKELKNDKNPMISDLKNYLVSAFSQILSSEDFMRKDLEERFKIIIPETYEQNHIISCEGIDFEFPNLQIPIDYNEVVSLIPQIRKNKNRIKFGKDQTKMEEKKVVATKTVETSVDKKEPVLDTVPEKKVEIKHTHEVIDDTLTPAEQQAELERAERASKIVWKYWKYLDRQEFLDRYYMSKKRKIELLKSFNTEENRAKYTNEQIVNMAIDWYIKKKKEVLEEYYTTHPEEDQKLLRLHNDHMSRQNARNNAILGQKMPKNEQKTERPALDSNNSYVDHLHKDQYKPEHTDDSRLAQDRIDRDQKNRNKGLNPKLVFAGSNIDSNDPFEDSKTAVTEFNRSCFGPIIGAVMNHEKNKTHARMLDFNVTKFVPIIDFDSGFRLVCIDLDDMNLRPGNINAIALSRSIRFSYSKFEQNFQTILLYNTEAVAKKDQVIAALLKLVNYFYYPEHKHLRLSDEFVLLYTTERKEIEEFEYKHSILPNGICKPKTNEVGIIALIDPKNYRSSRYRKREIADSMTRDYYENSGFNNLSNYRMEMVITARYIEKFIELDPNVDGIEGYWSYNITQYTEHMEALMDDGLSCVISAIIREHYAKKRGHMPYKVILEYDRTLLISPIIRKRLELLGYDECPFIVSAASQNVVAETTRECYKIFADKSFVIQDPSEKKFFNRVDPRFYETNEISFRKVMGKRIQPNIDVSTLEQRKQALAQLGFSVYYEPELVSYEVKANFLSELEQGDLTQNIIPVSVNDLRESNGYTNLELQSKIDYQVNMLNAYKNNKNMEILENSDDIWAKLRVFSANMTNMANGMNQLFGGNNF